MNTRKTVSQRSDYPQFCDIQTRWQDNDVYQHVNNVTYYAFFDTAVNQHLIANDVLDILNGDLIGLVVESGCRYLSPISFPDQLEVGLKVSKLGNSSVTYALAVFVRGDETPAAEGHFVHVFVDRQTRRPVPMPDDLRAVLGALQAN
ncbi:acyl-CoA thioester hydrolase [Sulfitobacter undariae]|uniref:Acyl-CoA thioester hydrolase n=1 Tax=Sulfitobacter undariae TaxID=1563671 RepID=A0A7W6E0K8_9RHOB|nr:thioesterase family protein [Sulfitobacter undariae]MBB3992527.1 acyl-CoA thioester hydrolase [Sulfitobacter undariae]